MDDYSGINPEPPKSGRPALVLSLALVVVAVLVVGLLALLLYELVVGISHLMGS